MSPSTSASPRQEEEDTLRAVGADPSFASYAFAVWNLIIRPPRARYTREDLVHGMPSGCFRLPGGSLASRSDFKLKNLRGATLVCTIFEPSSVGQAAARGEAVAPEADDERACVVFCHGNGSNRMQGFDLVPLVVSLGIALVCFDFAGSGMSGGDYVSLGFYERDDLACVVQHLRGERGFTRVGLWGVSMGAVTSLLQCARDPTIAGVVADSPFSSLMTLVQEICCRQLRLPSFLVNAILPAIRAMVRRKAKFDLTEVSPLSHVGCCFVPALFLHGAADDFVVPEHSDLLCRDYAGEKKRLLMPGETHTSRRPRQIRGQAAVFLVRALRWEAHLPHGVTERSLARLAIGALPNSFAGGVKDSPQRALAVGIEREIVELLNSKRDADVACGLIRIACELSGAYCGAELLRCTCRESNRAGASHFAEALPVAFTGSAAFLGGTGSFENRGSELALCWVTDEAVRHYAVAGCRIGFALLSPTALSLAEVELLPSLASDSGSGSDVQKICGMRCAALKPLALGATAGWVAFDAGRTQALELCLGADGIARFAAAGSAVRASLQSLQSSLEYSSSDGVIDDKRLNGVHLWCVHWRGKGEHGASDAARLELMKSTEVSETLAAPDVSVAESQFQERLASTLSTLCCNMPRIGGCQIDGQPELSSLRVEVGDFAIADSERRRL
eukprot:TRINITY_DN62814_c0_g1_i1.p1 TRINITY_DN62814_c0_g1~~TRINITY_DN62814_c0_g1_i1.p1  ORF type:complete len:676 (+),score=99.58 TRINITY_DN62814_c0_g1_i1:137-2164(+)